MNSVEKNDRSAPKETGIGETGHPKTVKSKHGEIKLGDSARSGAGSSRRSSKSISGDLTVLTI